MKLSSILLALLLPPLAPAASAQVTCFSNRSTWTSAVGPPTATEDFSSFPADVSFESAPVPLAIGSIHVSAGGAGFRNLIETPPFQYSDNNGTNHASVYTDKDQPTQVRITLGAPTTAVGFDVYDANDGEGLQVAWISGAIELGTCDVASNGACFVGVLSGQPFDTIEFRSRSSLGGGEGFGLDDIAVAGGAAVIAFCDPGAGAVIGCPCSNPPSGAQRGCDNSSATGGASISSTGLASIANDTLVFHTAAERPSATSIVLSGSSALAGGLAFGQGVRCVSGLLKRLYIQAASGGSISAPAAGEASVSARHAAVSDPVAAGVRRYYMVYYRDPFPLGGCSPVSTYNCTNALDVTWGN